MKREGTPSGVGGAKERPIRVELETEAPVRKPGRPRLDISANFQDTGEMANHSHRLVWCIACIKSGRELYRRDRLPARGDLMQRHLMTCKYVDESVRQRFRTPARSGSVSSGGEGRRGNADSARGIPSTAHSIPDSTRSIPSAGHSIPSITHIIPGAHVSTQSIAASGCQLPPINLLSSLLPPYAPRALESHSPLHVPRAHERQSVSPRASESHSPLPATRTRENNSPLPATRAHENYSLSRPHPYARVSPASSASSGSAAHTTPAPHVTPMRRLLAAPGLHVGVELRVASGDAARAAAGAGFAWALVAVDAAQLRAGAAAQMVGAAAPCVCAVRVAGAAWVRYAVDAGAAAVVVPAAECRAAAAECRRMHVAVVAEPAAADLAAVEAAVAAAAAADAAVLLPRDVAEHVADAALAAARRLGVPLGIVCRPADAPAAARRGFRLAVVAADVDLIAAAAAEHLRLALAAETP
ncbi:hypothetical protein H4R26_000170 [Coemansia thaxteri]|uniref:Uncharacterized protein n=1 Tax=Coemansia thaxteri TaxID=2663907 RepID=A0A9W8BPA6_9FUNG|nr:hypothetical protein H4R26_000170 [Coemansia thaxteri]KAJ2484912.1 hypothetical protein EV174_002083 [Coemansia sp. RSA 2320]